MATKRLGNDDDDDNDGDGDGDGDDDDDDDDDVDVDDLGRNHDNKILGSLVWCFCKKYQKHAKKNLEKNIF